MDKGAMVWWEDGEGRLESNWISSSRIFSGRTYESEAFYVAPDEYEHVVILDGADSSPATIRALLKAKRERNKAQA